jgi:peptide/nickel transport system substrate-binding protein
MKLKVGSTLLALAMVGGWVGAQTITVALPPATNINYLQPVTPANYYYVVNGWAYETMYKPLLWINKHIEIDYSRSIADSVTTPDGQHYFVTLNPKWHWSDGTPVTSADVIFDFDLINSISANNSSAYGGWGIGGIPNEVASVKALGPYKLEFTLKAPQNPFWFIYNGIAQLIPLPKHAWDKYPGDPAKTLAYLQDNGDNLDFFLKSPVDGPFRIVKSVLNNEFVFEANPYYDGHKPTYKTLIFRYFTTSDAEYNALRTGQVDIGYVPFHLSQHLAIPGYRVAKTSTWGISYIELNFNTQACPSCAPLKELAVRQALQMAIDQPGMIRAFYHGHAVAQYGPVPYEPPTYLEPILRAGYNPYPYNPAAGKALLEKNGWHLVNGVMTKGNMRLEFTLDYASGSTSTQQVAEYFAESASKEGIVIHLAPQPFDTIIANLGAPNKWQMLFYGNGWVYYPDLYPTGYGLYGTGGGSNTEDYSNPTADRLIAATHAYFPKNSQSILALYKYEDFLARDLPNLWLPEAEGAWTGAVGAITEYRDTLTGVVEHANPDGLISPQYWSYR